MKETYAPILLQRKVNNLRKETGRNLKTKFDRGQTARQLIITSIARPSKLLLQSPIVLLLSLYLSVVYSYMYLFLTTFTNIFEELYGFNSGEAGLAYLGLGIGFCVGQFSVGPFSDWYVTKKREVSGSTQPEDRLPPLLVGSCLVPIGLFWYGWSAKALAHWIVPIIGTAIFGMGMEYIFLPIQVYLIDTFTIYATSAIAANTVVRSLFGAIVPLAGNALYSHLGLGWGNSLLAFIAIAFAPFSLVLVKFGARIRTNPRFQVKL
jgi:MFS family permease